MLASTLFFATVLSTFFTAGSALTVAQPQNLVQCQNATLGWTSGNGPYKVDVYTGCSDSSTDPIATFTGLTSPTCLWYVNALSGETIMYSVTDNDGKEWWSDDAGVGGDSNQSGTCAAHIKSAKLTVESNSVNGGGASDDSTTTTTTPAAVLPTTASATPTSSAGGLDGVANAENGDTTTTGAAAKSTGGSGAIGAISAAGLNAVPSAQLALGFIGAAFLSLL
ncbi:hypothetical protein FRB95_003699 [Tulasnella sp. JGI-2019a]|nr:hypothetical protein FRB93_009979 [Tulasnella sp. JGI-2019a]KAG9037860.1 hypothetical protein FRB95_003699 [Tulasnella sp. JGI-2019a]